jgi:hypothetical protein
MEHFYLVFFASAMKLTLPKQLVYSAMLYCMINELFLKGNAPQKGV